MTARPPRKKRAGARLEWSDDYLGRYTDAQWEKIKKSLAGIGVDVAETMVGGPFRPRKPWWRSDHSTTIWQRPLYSALQEMAWFFGVVSQGHRTTPSEKAHRLESALTALVVARFSIDYFCKMAGPTVSVQKIFPNSAVNRADAALTELINLGLQHVKQLKATDRASSKNAQKVHTLYWLELMRLWQAIAPKNIKHKHYHLSEFLFACSQSLFPDTKHETITGFIERHFPQTNV